MKHLWIAAAFLFLISCGQVQDKTNDLNKEKVIQEVKEMFDDYHHDIKAGGLTAEFKYLDPSDDFFWVPPGYRVALSYDSVRTILETNAPQFSKIEFYWESLEIFPLSYEIATYTGVVGGTMTDTTGVDSNVRIIESGTVIKRTDGWKLLCGQSAALTQEP